MPLVQLGLHPVQLNEVWLVANTTPLSFDSRYYGAVRTADIKGIATPVLIWPGFSHE
jgi:type IV secretory pathway protease TraF